MREEDLRHVFRVLDALRDRTMVLLMLRCGLRVREVRTFTVAAMDWHTGTSRVTNGKGQVDRVGYVSPDVERALRHHLRTTPAPTPAGFPRPWRVDRPSSVRSIQRLMRVDRQEAQLPTT
jgi:site-specific recombinase XerC